jgi:hypothetical protein
VRLLGNHFAGFRNAGRGGDEDEMKMVSSPSRSGCPAALSSSDTAAFDHSDVQIECGGLLATV